MKWNGNGKKTSEWNVWVFEKQNRKKFLIWNVKIYLKEKRRGFNAMHLLYGNLNIKYSNRKACEPYTDISLRNRACWFVPDKFSIEYKKMRLKWNIFVRNVWILKLMPSTWIETNATYAISIHISLCYRSFLLILFHIIQSFGTQNLRINEIWVRFFRCDLFSSFRRNSVWFLNTSFICLFIFSHSPLLLRMISCWMRSNPMLMSSIRNGIRCWAIFQTRLS